MVKRSSKLKRKNTLKKQKHEFKKGGSGKKASRAPPDAHHVMGKHRRR